MSNALTLLRCQHVSDVDPDPAKAADDTPEVRLGLS
jgi:hypothetical protein